MPTTTTRSRPTGPPIERPRRAGDGRADAALRRRGRDERAAGLLEKRSQLVLGAGPADSAAGHDQRPARLPEELDGSSDDLGVGAASTLDVDAGLRQDVGHGDIAAKHVGRDLEVHRPRPPRPRPAQPFRDVLGDAPGLQYGARPFRDRGHDLDLRDVLERAQLELAKRRLPADDEQRRAGLICVGDGGHDVRDPRPRRDDGDPYMAAHARVRVRHVPGSLFVADVDDADLLVDTAVVDRTDMAAVEAEDHLDARLLGGSRRRALRRSCLRWRARSPRAS